MHHVMTNAVIDITGPDTARHQCYWMTVSGGPAMYSFRIAAQGRYEDEFVQARRQVADPPPQDPTERGHDAAMDRVSALTALLRSDSAIAATP